MAVQNPTLALAVEAARNDATEFISRVVFPTVRFDASEVTRLPGQNAFKAKAYRVAKDLNFALGEKSLRRGAKGESRRVSTSLTDYDITIEERSIEHDVDRHDIAGLGNLGLQNYEGDIVAPMLASLLEVDREREAAALIKDTSAFTQGLDATAAPWTNPSTDVIGQLQTGLSTVRTNGNKWPNYIAFSLDYWNTFSQRSDVKDLFGDAMLDLTAEQIGQRLTNAITRFNPSVPPLRIFVGSATYDATNEGQTASKSAIYSSHAIMGYNPALEDGGSVFDTIDARRLAAGKSYEIGSLTTESYPERERKAIVYGASEHQKFAAFDPTLAYTFYNAV